MPTAPDPCHVPFATIAVTLATLTIHAPAAHSLEIKNLRLTCGEGGAARLDKEIVCGETVHAAFDVHGTKNDGLYEILFPLDNGKIRRFSELPEQPLSDGQRISMHFPVCFWRRGTWDRMLTAGSYVLRIIVTNKTNNGEFACVDYPVNVVYPLKISNFRLTYGEKGVARLAQEIVIGDSLCATFELNGANSDGRYEVNYKLYDA
jgi:hypothetical protein